MKAHDEHIHSEILSQIGKENGFVVPKNYFETFPAKVNQLLLLEKTSEQSFVIPNQYFDKLPERVSQRTQLPKIKEAIAPTQYFDELPQRIQARIYEEESKRKWQLVPTIPNWSYALAASVCLLIGLLIWMKPDSTQVAQETHHTAEKPVCLMKKKEQLQVQVSTATQAEIQTHVEEQLIDHLDETLLIEELENQEPNQELAIEQAEIKDYLLENHVDQTLLEDAIH